MVNLKTTHDFNEIAGELLEENDIYQTIREHISTTNICRPFINGNNLTYEKNNSERIYNCFDSWRLDTYPLNNIQE